MASVADVARTKEFDPDTALEVAMGLFWQRGYEGTSTAELVTATGVARASLYATFGGKRDLYMTCLSRYLDAVQSPEEVVASAESPLAAIRTLMTMRGTVDTSLPSGCFSVNATIEHGETDAEIGRRLEGDRQRVESALHTALLGGQRDGSIRSDLDASATARMLLSTVTGMRAISRAGASQQLRLDDTIAAALSLITA